MQAMGGVNKSSDTCHHSAALAGMLLGAHWRYRHRVTTSRSPRLSWRARHTITLLARHPSDEDDDGEDEDNLDQIVLEVAQELAKQLGSLIPIVGPAMDIGRGLRENNGDLLFWGVLWFVADVATWGTAEEAKAAKLIASEAGRLVKMGEKGVKLRKLADAAKRAQQSHDTADKVKWVLSVMEKFWRAADNLMNKKKEEEEEEEEEEKEGHLICMGRLSSGCWQPEVPWKRGPVPSCRDVL
ncbi:unnamed protein product [Prorocentrum cordatum]|uniref:Uncharacterized protein n=1 Tax=Prorocentrum cordatum TaxID=2364126 RepID=A0ABN9UP88_9DINO|nr:unnamed protein product [Polarella glacialis]